MQFAADFGALQQPPPAARPPKNASVPRNIMALMTLVGCAALHLAPTLSVAPKLAIAGRRTAVVVMDEEVESYSVPFATTNVTVAAAEIKEVLTLEGFSEATAPSPEDAAKAAWLAKTYGEPPSSYGYAAPAEASPPTIITQELAALLDEKNDLDEALENGYDAEKVKRLAEVEAMLAEADVSSAAPELSPEEAAKAKWLAERTRPSWGPGTSGY